jgi:hypothetical protein
LFVCSGNIWLDTSGALYKAFECKRGKEFCLGPNTYHQVKRAIAAGLKYPTPPIQGDPLYCFIFSFFSLSLSLVKFVVLEYFQLIVGCIQSKWRSLCDFTETRSDFQTY